MYPNYNYQFLCVCVCVCVYVCVCVLVCVCVCVCVCVLVCVCWCVHVCVHACVPVCMSRNVDRMNLKYALHWHIRIYISSFRAMPVLYTQVHTHTHTHMHPQTIWGQQTDGAKIVYCQRKTGRSIFDDGITKSQNFGECLLLWVVTSGLNFKKKSFSHRKQKVNNTIKLTTTNLFGISDPEGDMVEANNAAGFRLQRRGCYMKSSSRQEPFINQTSYMDHSPSAHL